MQVSRSMGARADAYRAEHGLTCQSCCCRFPAGQLSTTAIGGVRRRLCIDCSRDERQAQRAARLASLTQPCEVCWRTLPVVRAALGEPEALFVRDACARAVCPPCAATIAAPGAVA
jgi:hypothetical protein